MPPTNVIVTAGERVKVGDFGLAEPVTDKVFGAPAYLSPEQVEGRPVAARDPAFPLAAIAGLAKLDGEGGPAQPAGVGQAASSAFGPRMLALEHGAGA